MAKTKRCRQCRKQKPREQFNIDKKRVERTKRAGLLKRKCRTCDPSR